MYFFSENSGGKLPEQEALVSNFFCIKACHCFCDISEINAHMCLKFCNEVTSHIPDPKPHVSSEFVSPIGIYDPFPTVTCYRTVQNNEVVRTATCHCFIFWF